MNRTIYGNGFHLAPGALDLMDKCWADAINDVVRRDRDYILSGCEVTYDNESETYNISDGVIVYGGEVLPFKASSYKIEATDSSPKIKVKQTFATNVYKDATVHDSTSERWLECDKTGSIEFLLLDRYVTSFAPQGSYGWHQPEMMPGFEFIDYSTALENFRDWFKDSSIRPFFRHKRYKVDECGCIHLYGAVKAGLGTFEQSKPFMRLDVKLSHPVSFEALVGWGVIGIGDKYYPERIVCHIDTNGYVSLSEGYVYDTIGYVLFDHPLIRL